MVMSTETGHTVPGHPTARPVTPEHGDRGRYLLADNANQYVTTVNNSRQNDTDRVLEVVCGQLALTRIPLTEPGVFDGRSPLAFPLWKINFDALTSNKAITATDRVNLLSRYLGGEARTVIEGYLTLPPEKAFD